MAKEQLSGSLHEPVTAILGSRGKIALLRELWRDHQPGAVADGLSLREIARRSGLAYGSIELASRDLAALGLVDRNRGGREFHLRLQRSHRLLGVLASLFHAESDFYTALRSDIRAALQLITRAQVLSAALVGSVTRAAETIGQAIDVVVVVGTPAQVADTRKQLDPLISRCNNVYGVKLQVMIYHRDEAGELWRRRTVAAERAVDAADTVAGQPLRELLDGLIASSAGHSGKHLSHR